jgi:hypothetical protein
VSLSPLVEFIIDFIASGLGGVGSKPREPFPEGETNASLGAVAAFTGGLALIFALLLLLNTSIGSGFSASDYASLSAASLVVAVVAYGGRRAGARALGVITRNLGLARFGTVVAALALGMSIASCLIAVVRFILHL